MTNPYREALRALQRALEHENIGLHPLSGELTYCQSNVILYGDRVHTFPYLEEERGIYGSFQAVPLWIRTKGAASTRQGAAPQSGDEEHIIHTVRLIVDDPEAVFSVQSDHPETHGLYLNLDALAERRFTLEQAARPQPRAASPFDEAVASLFPR